MNRKEGFWRRFNNDLIGDRAVVLVMLVILLLVVTGVVPGLFEQVPK